MISNSEASDSSEINFAFCAAKRARHEDNVAAGAGCERFKGIVPQQNGHWGAQIYSNHQRIWLGTFKSETEAAMAYDSATIKLRSGESHRNFPWNDQTVQEPRFQSHYSIETVLNMIRNGTYQTKFSTFLRTQNSLEGIGTSTKHLGVKGHEQFSCTHLFQKELTPSDVGKLNRLVIPKKHAVTYFPSVCGGSGATNGGGEMDGVDIEVVFYDKLMRLWKFRYCYWKSSQSYVFTRGWNRFVKDKKLKAKDIIAFYLCEPISCRRKGEVFSLIDVIYNNNNNNTDHRRQCVDETQNLGNKLICNDEVEDQDEGQETKDRKDDLNAQRGLRLFGVSIN